MERALVGGAVAEEADGHPAGAERLGGERRAAGQRDAAADDAVGAEHPFVDVGDVHRAALALADAGRLAHQLGHHAGDVDALGDAVTVAAVGRGDEVVVGQVGADADRDGLLAGVKKNGETRGRAAGDFQAGGSVKWENLLFLAYQAGPVD